MNVATRPLSLILLGVTALGVTACSSEQMSEGGPSVTASTQSQSATQPQSLAATTITPLGEANPTRKTQAVQAPAKLVPTAMRVGTHEGFDRVVIELAGEGTPGWHIDYTQAPQQQASGEQLKIAGGSFLDVNIDGTTYPFELGLEPANLTPAMNSGPVVAEVISGGTFEGRSQFIIGVNGGQRPYSVSYLEDPKRLVIDFHHN